MMKRIALLGLGVVVLLAGGSARASDPLDLAVTGLNCTIQEGHVLLEAEILLAATGFVDPIVTQVGFYLDGAYVGGTVYDVMPLATSACEFTNPPECPGVCEPAEINGQIREGFCQSWLVLSEDCVCVWLALKWPDTQVPYLQQTEAMATIDPDGLILEADETNNTLVVPMGPVSAGLGTSVSSWGRVKALYR